MFTYSQAEISKILNISKQAVQKRAAKEGWPASEVRAQGGKRCMYELGLLPEDIQKKIVFREAQKKRQESTETKQPFSYDREALWSHYDSRTTKQKEKALERQQQLLKAAKMVDSSQFNWLEAFKMIAESDGSVSWQTLRDTYHGRPGKPGLKNYDRGDWLAALVPQHKGRLVTADITDKAWEYFKADYLRNEQPTLTACYRRLKKAAAEHDWVIPSLKTMERLIKALPVATRVFLREGEHALMRLYPPLERSVEDLHAMEWINGDGYQHNNFVRWPSGEINRPKTWFWQDIYSRKIIGWRTDITENTDIIRLSFGDVVEEYGIPDHITIDNTRAAANKWMTGRVPNRYRFKVKDDDPMGIWPSMDIDVHWTSVIAGHGHGQAKPVERAFGVGGLEEYIDKSPALAGSYTGPNPNAKPENYGSRAVDLETFLEAVAEGVAMFNAEQARKTEMCRGVHSFDEAFEASYATAMVRKATNEQRRLWLLAAESVRVNRQFGSVRLEAGALKGTDKERRHNRYDADFLLEHRGEKIIVRFDPDNLHEQVHCYTLDGRYLGAAECADASGFGDTQNGRQHTRARKQFMKAAKEQARAEQSMNALEAAELLPKTEKPDAPETKVIRPVFQQAVGSDIALHDPEVEVSEYVSQSDNLILDLWEAKKAQQD